MVLAAVNPAFLWGQGSPWMRSGSEHPRVSLRLHFCCGWAVPINRICLPLNLELWSLTTGGRDLDLCSADFQRELLSAIASSLDCVPLWLNLCLLVFAYLPVLDSGPFGCIVCVRSSIIHQAIHSFNRHCWSGWWDDPENKTDPFPVLMQLISEWTLSCNFPLLFSLQPHPQIWSSTTNFYTGTGGLAGKDLTKFKLFW